MMPWQTLDRARAPDGGELVLRCRDGEYEIRVDGHELMSSRAHGSEEAMAELACAHLAATDTPRVLVGGLGMGYTLRATLNVLPASARVLAAELVPAVVAWNRGPLAGLAARPLDDARVEVHEGDVLAWLRKTTVRVDAVLLDVDNGPKALTRKGNQVLYSAPGLDTIKRALRPRGVLAVWSADRSPAFERDLRRAGFDAKSVDVPARGVAGGPKHTIFLARLPDAPGKGSS
jgi:spermidine synthase